MDNTKKLDLGAFPSILYEGTQTNWNGLIGKLELQAMDPVWIEDVQAFPDVKRRTVKVSVTIGACPGFTPLLAVFDVDQHPVNVSLSESATHACAEIPLGGHNEPWDELSPDLQQVVVEIVGHETDRDMRGKPRHFDPCAGSIVPFGIRTFAADGTHFTMNDRSISLRGTLECGIFPKTGYPPMDVPSWQRIMRIAKSYGLNFIRFHSWCPPEAAFTAADMEGIIIQAEGPIANVDKGVGKDPARDQFIEQELLRMVRTYGNHPSFCLMTVGNEYGGDDKLLSHWIDMLRKEDPRRLYCSPTCGQNTANRQFTERDIRGVRGPGTDGDLRAELAKQDRPLVGHEIGQWTFYPNFDEIKKYDGVLAAKNFELVRDDLARKKMLDLAPRFFQATGKQAVLLYKEEIEVIMRTPGYQAFSLLDLHDYPGQGTALIGLLDPFWDSKGFITPEAHRRYCGPVVPLARLKKRTFTADEPLTAAVEIAQFGPRDLPKSQPVWAISDGQGHVIASGELPQIDLPTGKLTSLGQINASLAKAETPCKLNLTVLLKGTEWANDWDIWVYRPPAPISPISLKTAIVSHWADAKAALAAGKKVLFLPAAGEKFANALPGKFLPVFWSPIWFPTQVPNTMGILCDPQHPALACFPTEFYSNWQWWDLLNDSQSMILDATPAGFRPIVQVIDNFGRNHKLGNLFEARVGKGRLLVCTINLPPMYTGVGSPAARQLLYSIYAYACSDRFQPASELDVKTLDALFAPAAGGKKTDGK
jgi:hypothetical protein